MFLTIPRGNMHYSKLRGDSLTHRDWIVAILASLLLYAVDGGEFGAEADFTHQMKVLAGWLYLPLAMTHVLIGE